MFREPINVHNANALHEALKAHLNKYDNNNDTQKDCCFFVGSTVAIQQEDGGRGMYRFIG